jgi:L-ornithine Nalpha-acyltransferase
MAIKIHDYQVRMVRNAEERRSVRALRYEVFVEEEGAQATDEQKELHEEWDDYDRYADYMGVFHKDKLVGTYRIINRESAEKLGGFYTETEFNITKIKNARGNIAEMSRACVRKEYRENGLVMRMLWLGLSNYILKKKISILFGVASWVGTSSVESAQAISYLYYNCLSPMSLRATVLSDKMGDGVNPKLSRMNILPKAFVDEKLATEQMTPLVKGYLRLGATFGKGVFIDKKFNSYDVFVMMQTKKMSSAYQKHFTGSENAFADFGLKDGPIKKIGKVLVSPITGLAVLARFILKPDEATDVEEVEDTAENQ